MRQIKVYLLGQKHLGRSVYTGLRDMEVDIVGVCAPLSDRHLRPEAEGDGYIVSDSVNGDMRRLTRADLALTVHSFDIIRGAALAAPRLGWIGYHPSLLPLFRGRNAVADCLAAGQKITGGTVYWLDSGIDTGEVALRDWCYVPQGSDARSLWRERLQPTGERLLLQAVDLAAYGSLPRFPQSYKNAPAL